MNFRITLTMIFLASFLASAPLSARTSAEYLPADSDLDPNIPTPESVLGWEVGDWHVSHDKLAEYMKALAAASPRVSLKVTGHSYERRPLMLLTITSEENTANLEEMRQAHIEGESDSPLVVWLGYSVHGNEPSGGNASMLMAYYLAASQSDYVSELLNESIVLIDPVLNPDGFNRFASWANSNAGKIPVTDPFTRQHAQAWPYGRTNHYLFDLNRDWLPLVHPESRARMTEFQRWRPHVLTDHHEQGGFPGFFYQPGVPTRKNPLTPNENVELTAALGEYHRRTLEDAGQPIFIEEAFDDFYYGKGSSYPDINGSIGILFEQLAIRGQALATSNGIETFPMAVANQLRVSLSTLQGSWDLRDRLIAYQRDFYRQKMQAANDIGFSGWIVSDDGDPARGQLFLDLLNRHDIAFEAIAETVRAGDVSYEPGSAWYIPARQRQFGLLQSIMEMRTEFQDETFYDVSAWTLPLANNLPFATVRQAPRTEVPTLSSDGLPPAEDAVGWLIPWNQLGASSLLQQLLVEGARVRTATKPFSVQTTEGLTSFAEGTLLIQSGIQDDDVLNEVRGLLSEAALNGLSVHTAEQTVTAIGPDFGSRHFALIKPIKPLLIGGFGTNPYDVGEAWFTLDQRLSVETTIVELSRLSSISLNDYTHLIMPDGGYDGINPNLKSTIQQWISDGGILISMVGGASWAESLCFEPDPVDCEKASEEEEEEPVGARPYAAVDDDRAQLVIGGAIVGTVLDTTHPMAFGFPRNVLPIMRRGTITLEPSDNPYATPVRYSEDPLLAGFISDRRISEFAGGPAMIADKQGRGLVVRFANTPLFRGFWRGSERLFINAVFFGQVVQATELPGE